MIKKKTTENLLKQYDKMSPKERKLVDELYADYILSEKTETYLKYVYYVHNKKLLLDYKNLSPKARKELLWVPGKHCVFICNAIDDFLNDKLMTSDGKIASFLILSQPPQTGKSTMLTETLPSYFLGKNPKKKVIEVSYGDSLSKKFGRRNRQKLEEFGEELFDIKLSPTRNTDQEFEVFEHKGVMISRGILSGITGNPGDLIIIDDPLKNRVEADSQTRRDKIWDEYLNSIKTRMSANAKLILIMTRWHYDDIAANIREKEEGVIEFNFPMEAEEGDILGRKPGESLFPEIGKDTKWMQGFKKIYLKEEGTRSWNALFQGKPSFEEGNLVKNYWWKFWKPRGSNLPPVRTVREDGSVGYQEAKDLPTEFDEIIQSWDCTFKDTTSSDKVAGVVVGRKITELFVVDCVNKQMDIIKTISSIDAFNKIYPTIKRRIIEEKANGAAVIQIMNKRLSGVIPVSPRAGDTKEGRVVAVSPAIESGCVYLPHPALFEWGNEMLTQFNQFPLGKYDDMVDAVSQAINDLMYRSRTFDTVEKGISGTTSIAYLKMKGYKTYQIKQMVLNGQIKLIEGERI